MNHNILITGIGGPTPRSIAKTLKKFFPDYKIIGIDSNPKAIGFYIPELIDKKYIAPNATDPEYWSFIENLISNENIYMAFVQPEIEVIEWGKYYKSKGTYPCRVFIPPLEYSQLLVNKARMSELLKNSDLIPKTLIISSRNCNFEKVEDLIGYPCWIRASTGSGGFGSLKISTRYELEAWLFIHEHINEFTLSEFLPGRHLANQMMYIEGICVRNAGLECVEYVMADIAPSKVTGNTSFGRFINEPSLLNFCEESMMYISGKLGVKPHGVYSFDLKEDKSGNLKITEINVRHMAYTGILADAGFNLIVDTIRYLSGDFDIQSIKNHQHIFEKPYIFLRDVDIEPIILDGEHYFESR